MKKKILLSLVLLFALTQGVRATAYNYYIAEKNGTTLTFRGSDVAPNGTNQWSITETSIDAWAKDDLRAQYTKAVFDPSFAEARPTSTYGWFVFMENLQSIEGWVYLNTEEVTNMNFMFADCKIIKELNLVYFNTSKVKTMTSMFMKCFDLETIYVGDGWDISNLTDLGKTMMFLDCNNLKGDDGIAYYDADNHDTVNSTLAHTGPGGYLTSERYLWDTHVAEDFYNVDDNTITIINRGEMSLMAQEVNAGRTTYDDKTFLLGKDLVYDGTNSLCTRIGDTDNRCFNGIFDGQGHSISGIAMSGTGRQALFGTVGAGTVKNLTLDNCTITNTNNGLAAGIAARISNGGTVENCHVTENVIISGGGHVGGIVGTTYVDHIRIAGCTSAATVSTSGGTYSAGGIVGTCGYEGSSSKSAFVTIEDCFYYGSSVSGADVKNGAIAGHCTANPYSTLTFKSNYYIYPNASLKAFGQKSTRVGSSGSVTNTNTFDLADDNGGVRTRVVTDEDDIADMGSQNGNTYNDGIAIYENGAAYDGIFYSHVVALDKDADNTETVEAYDGMTFDVVLRGHEVHKDNAWHTLCLPFSTTTTGGPLKSNGVKVRQISTTSYFLDGKLNLYIDKTPTSIAANQPFVIKCTDEELVNPVFQNVTIDKVSNEVVCNLDNGKSLTFHGIQAPETFTSANRSILLIGEDNTLCWPEAETTIGAQEAYFVLSDLTAGTTEGVHEYLLYFGDEEFEGTFEIIDEIATGINNAKHEKGNAGLYTLDGRKLSGKPAQKGIYIVNGKKTVVM